MPARATCQRRSPVVSEWCPTTTIAIAAAAHGIVVSRPMLEGVLCESILHDLGQPEAEPIIAHDEAEVDKAQHPRFPAAKGISQACGGRVRRLSASSLFMSSLCDEQRLFLVRQPAGLLRAILPERTSSAMPASNATESPPRYRAIASRASLLPPTSCSSSHPETGPPRRRKAELPS